VFVPRPSGADGRKWPPDDDGWGPSTAVYSGSATRGAAASPASPRTGRAFYPNNPPRPQPTSEPWTPVGPRPSRDERAVRATDRRTERSIEALRTQQPERGLTWWAAVLLLIAIAGLGGLIDTLGSIQVKGGFNIGIVIASVVAIIAVKRSHMFPIVIAPPIVYSGAALFQLYVRSRTSSNTSRVVLDAAANYLVYGFPAIAASSAAVLIIAGIRLITRK
jgi:hypothetical protein